MKTDGWRPFRVASFRDKLVMEPTLAAKGDRAKHQLQPNAGETLSTFIEQDYKQEIKLKPELIKTQHAYCKLHF